MNIHEYQAKEILKEHGASVSEGVVVFKPEEIDEKIKILNTEKLVLKAQIHAGGRGKAGGVKLVDRAKIYEEAKTELDWIRDKMMLEYEAPPLDMIG